MAEAPFCRPAADTNCFISLTLHTDETASHRLRQFPEWQILYVVEFTEFFDLANCGKDWHPPCTIPGMRDYETRCAFGGTRREEGWMK
jgi:hypothetical protein